MSLRHVRAVIVNDARLHGRGIVMAQAGVVAFTWLASRMPRPQAALLGLVLNLNIVIALLWGDWLISREKLKGTFGWLRTTPIADGDLVTAKFLSTAICCTLMWTLTTAPFLSGYYADRPAEWIVTWLGLMTFAGLSVAMRWRFTQKLGLIAPLLTVLLPLLLFTAVNRYHPETARTIDGIWDRASGRVAIGAAFAVALILVYMSTRWWVERSDTVSLLE